MGELKLAVNFNDEDLALLHLNCTYSGLMGGSYLEAWTFILEIMLVLAVGVYLVIAGCLILFYRESSSDSSESLNAFPETRLKKVRLQSPSTYNSGS